MSGTEKQDAGGTSGASGAVADANAWTVKRLLEWLKGALAKAGVESPALCAEMLLGHVLRCDRLRLYTSTERVATAEELATLRGLAQRALKHEPVQYLVGTAWFYGMSLKVDRRVLIPRPCTEGLVEEAVKEAKRRNPGVKVAKVLPWKTVQLPGAVAAGGASASASTAAGAAAAEPAPLGPEAGEGLAVLDLCTGSGCVALACAKQLPGAEVTGTDLSADALAVARANAQSLGLADRVEWLEGDLLEPVAGRTFDIVLANPPYIPDAEWEDVPANVKQYEPTGALRGGSDGLETVGRLLDGVWRALRPGGLVMVEVAASTAAAAVERVRTGPGARGLEDARIIRDLEGHERFVLARRKA